MRIIFFGSPVFALPSLAAAQEAGHTLVAVVTQPDRPTGRGRENLTPPPVAIAARERGLALLQPERPAAADFMERVRALAPEAFAVVAYGNLLPDPLLALAPRGAWNVHPSLLPRWRGPAPVHRTIHAGDTTTGVSIIRLVRKLDAGPVAMQEQVPVGARETRGELERRLADLGARMLVLTLAAAATGPVPVTEQREADVTYAGMFGSADREIRWDQPAAELDRLVRALAPSPSAWFNVHGERVKLLTSGAWTASGTAGVLIERGSHGDWLVGCGEGSLWVDRVQPAGKSVMTMDAFITGRRLGVGDSVR